MSARCLSQDCAGLEVFDTAKSSGARAVAIKRGAEGEAAVRIVGGLGSFGGGLGSGTKHVEALDHQADLPPVGARATCRTKECEPPALLRLAGEKEIGKATAKRHVLTTLVSAGIELQSSLRCCCLQAYYRGGATSCGVRVQTRQTARARR